MTAKRHDKKDTSTNNPTASSGKTNDLPRLCPATSVRATKGYGRGVEVQLHPLTSALIHINGQLRRLEAIFMQYICNPSDVLHWIYLKL